MKIVIVGARHNGHAGVVLDNILLNKQYEVVGFLDNSSSLKGKKVLGIPVLGSSDDKSCIPKDVGGFFIAIGDNESRMKLGSNFESLGLNAINVIHPSAIISDNVKIGKGVFIGANAVINNGCAIGDYAIINTSSSIDHDTMVGEGVHIAPGVVTAGRVTIGKYSFIGLGAKIIPDVRIGNNALIGAGAVVIGDVPSSSKYVGVPARPIKYGKESIYKWIK